MRPMTRGKQRTDMLAGTSFASSAVFAAKLAEAKIVGKLPSETLKRAMAKTF